MHSFTEGSLKRPFLTLAVIFVVTLVVALAGCATVAGGAPLTGPDGVEGWRSAHAIFYVVPARGGVVLIDAGMDPTGADVIKAIGARRPLAVLVTHGHVDHWSGAHALAVPVYIGRADLPLLTRTGRSRALVPRIGERALAPPPLPRELFAVDDGDVIQVGGRTFVAVAMPGHTRGSVAWLVDDLAFTGDALLGDGNGGVDVAGSLISDDVTRARASLHRLWPRSFTFLLDGHAGITPDAHTLLGRRLAAQRREGP